MVEGGESRHEKMTRIIIEERKIFVSGIKK